MKIGRKIGHIVEESSRKKMSKTHKKIGTIPPSRKGIKHLEDIKKLINREIWVR